VDFCPLPSLVEATIFSVTFFNDHEGDVVGLRHALSKILNGFQEPLLDRVTSRGALSLNNF
jgi:hypothetical protein